jgi:hypothetical protein
MTFIHLRPGASVGIAEGRVVHDETLTTLPERPSADLESVRGPRSEEAGQRVQLPRPVIVHAAPAASRAAQCGDPEPHPAPSLRDALRAPVTRPPRRAERSVRGSRGGAGSVRWACDTTRPSTVSHGHYRQRSPAGQRRCHDYRSDSQAGVVPGANGRGARVTQRHLPSRRRTSDSTCRDRTSSPERGLPHSGRRGRHAGHREHASLAITAVMDQGSAARRFLTRANILQRSH